MPFSNKRLVLKNLLLSVFILKIFIMIFYSDIFLVVGNLLSIIYFYLKYLVIIKLNHLENLNNVSLQKFK
jgi:predicted membrane protein